MGEKEDLINKINADRSNTIPIFGANTLGSVHNKIIGKLTGAEQFEKKNTKKGGGLMEERAQKVMATDKAVRKSIQDLVLALSDLGDKEIALNLIGNHILFLNDMFKEFEGDDNK